MKLIFSIPLGAQVAPFGKVKRPILDGLFGFFGDMLHSADTTATNEQNVAMTAMTNRSNERINSEQLAAARKQFEDELFETQRQRAENREWQLEDCAYNEPAKLKQRYLDAGINPYLAMMNGGAGSVGSVGSSSVSVPHGEVPGSIPMQAPRVEQNPYFGNAFQNLGSSIQNFIQWLDSSEREDYRLASDITARLTDSRLKAVEAATKAKEAGIHDKQVNHMIRDANRRFALETDKFWQSVDLQSFQKEVQSYQLAQRDTELKIQKLLADSNVHLNSAQAKNFLQLVQESIQKVDSMKKGDWLSERQFWHEISEDLWKKKAALTELGIHVEKLPFEKFGALFGALAQTVGLGLGAYLGLKGGVGFLKNSYSRTNIGFTAPKF